MSIDIDAQLRECFEQKTLGVEIPPENTAALIARGRRTRAIRLGAITTSVIAAAAVVTAVGVFGQDDSPGRARTDAQQASGDTKRAAGPPVVTNGATGPASVPGPRGVFYTEGTMYVGGHRLRADIPFGTGAHIGQQGIAFPAHGSSQPSLITNDGRLERLAPVKPTYGRSYSSWVAADSDSSLVAWTENGKRTGQVVAYDTSRHRVIARKTVACDVTGKVNPCPWPYIADSGKVFIESQTGTNAWDPRTGKTTALNDTPSQAHRKVIAFFGSGIVELSGLGPGWTTLLHGGLLSYDGQWVLAGESSTRIRSRIHPDQTIRFRPPGDVVASQFDTDGSLLVVTTTSDQATYTGWDCGLSGPCQRVVGPTSREIRLVAWDT